MLSFSQTFFKSISFAALFVLHMMCMMAVLPAESGPLKDMGEIIIPRLNVRDEPGTHGRIIGVLTRGEQVPIISHEDGWFEIRIGNKVGYIRAKDRYVRKIVQREENGAIDSHHPDDDLIQYREEAELIQHQLEAAKAQVVSFTEKETDVIHTLNELDYSLNTTRKQVRSLERELSALENQIKTSEKQISDLSAQIKTTEAYAYQRLVALYKLSWLGETHMLASAESVFDIIRRQRGLEHILSADEQILSDLWKNKNNLQNLLNEQNDQIGKKRRLDIEVKQQIQELSRKRDRRSQLLANIRNQKSLEMAAIDALSRSANALNEKIRSLSETPSFDRERQSIEDPGQKPFSHLKGLLKMPVKGKVIATFGPYNNTEFNVMNFRSGIDIKADRGEPIHAVYSGKVLYASWFKGYGNMLIIDHGDNYYTVYANIEELFKSPGDHVQRDEVVATVGDAGSRIGSKLYFEVRHHGKPLDPLHWLKKG